MLEYQEKEHNNCVLYEMIIDILEDKILKLCLLFSIILSIFNAV